MSIEPVSYSQKNGVSNEAFVKDETDITKANGGTSDHVVASKKDFEVEGKPEDHSCSWRSIRPSGCQRGANIKCVVFFLSVFSLIQGMVVNGLVNGVISNLERRFSISSTESGIIASCYDIASVLLLIPVTYFGGQGVKPRYLGIGILVMGIGSFVFTIPHWATDIYSVDGTASDVCVVGSNNTNICEAENSLAHLSNYKYLFFLGQLLHGAGAAPLYTLGVTYIDENLPPRSSSFYVGIFYTFALVGPAVGYLLGGEFLKIYTDVGNVDTGSLSIDADSPRWVGAWWIGFLVSGVLALCITLPMSGFPRSLPGSEKYKAERGKEAYHKEGSEDPEKVGLKRGFKDILLSVKLLITNPTFMFLNFAAASEGLMLSGFSTFGPKYLESQFSFSSGWAAQILGFAVLPAGGGGTLLGGYLVKRFNWKVHTIIKFCLCMTVISILPCLIFLMNCENVPFAGINTPYVTANASGNLDFMGTGELHNTCNAPCSCNDDIYNPVCGIDKKMYFSPCYAGCLDEIEGETKKYTNCSCINSNVTSEIPYMAVTGKCTSSCPWLPMFMPLFAFIMLLTFVVSMPALSATLRCVPEHQRTFGLGIQWIIARCLGSIPGPILFGKLIDLTCVVWQDKCGEQGSCFLYDNKNMSYNLMGLGMALKTSSCICFFLSLMLYKKSPNKELEITETTTTTSMTSSTSSKIINGDAELNPKKETEE